MNIDFFAGLMNSIAERGRALIGAQPAGARGGADAGAVLSLCRSLLSGAGEATGAALAIEALAAWRDLDGEGRAAFFLALEEEFGPDPAAIDAAVESYGAARDAVSAAALHYAAEPRRLELFRRLNRAPGATALLVDMRADLLARLRAEPALAPVDRDLQHLFASWFNRGFLVLRRIDWSTPADILEKIIRYEAVHEIGGWSELRRRIEPADRRCYAFFHPALNDEPLIFVEIALTEAMPGAIAPLLASDRDTIDPARAKTAVFYSISNCQKGLAGVTFGNFLIKQVVEELRRDLPGLQQFATLSPAPDFLKWIGRTQDLPIDDEGRAALAMLDEPDWVDAPAQAERLRKVLEPLAAHYYLKARRSDGRVVDSVARFHLGNGARLERINWLGDLSPKGMSESAGVMVNYLYDLGHIERNHEAFANLGEVAASSQARRLLKTEKRPWLPTPSFG